MQVVTKVRGAVAAAAVICIPLLIAADHQDGSTATADPSADITDVFAWMSPDASHLNLVMDLFPAATSSSMFSDSVQYVFHVRSKKNFTDAASTEVATDIICTFDSSQKISCWAGGSYVTGDASSTAGIKSSDGKIQAFAGLRDDPFFFNLDGFKATAMDVHAAAIATLPDGGPALTFDPAGCPQLDSATVTALVTQLKSSPDGGPAVDHFAHLNVLSIVLSIDKTLVNSGGPIIDVWASTRN